jgi:hypothetical protein
VQSSGSLQALRIFYFGLAETDSSLRSRSASSLRRESAPSNSKVLEEFFRSPTFIEANGSHEVRCVPPRLLARCGLAWEKASLGEPGSGG